MMRAGEGPELESSAVDTEEAVPQPPLSRVRKVKRFALGAAVIFALILVWLIVTAPLSRSLQPVGAPGLTILSIDGEPIARRGAIIGEPVAVERLPAHVGQAFLAIEDRRFYSHIGVDPWGILRAMVRNIRAGGVREGGSTISQQLAKTSFLSPDRTAARKIQEALIALWLEVWLSKEEILSRYLSNVYFGDNVYG
ncbi:MAG TPA: biosynthetic peptidoglycan transglycosylase, partial [Allosphingosinicella sp.]|nr:biosynthetic peptidoglycan transglycosylase [Allosphingosinicella sp.]